MKSIGIIRQKGGAGKTALAIHLVVAWAQAARNIAMLDRDPASAVKWGKRRLRPVGPSEGFDHAFTF